MAPRPVRPSKLPKPAKDLDELADKAVENVVEHTITVNKSQFLRNARTRAQRPSIFLGLPTSPVIALPSSSRSVPTTSNKSTRRLFPRLPTLLSVIRDSSGSRSSAVSSESSVFSGPVIEPGQEKPKLSFMSLPLEVRYMIYRYLFVRRYPIRPVSQQSRVHRMRKGGRKLTQWRWEEQNLRAAPLSSTIDFLRVSKEVSLEAAPFVYGAPNEFLLYTDGPDADHVTNWLVNIGDRNQKLICTLSIDWNNGVYGSCRSKRILNIITRNYFHEVQKTRGQNNAETRACRRRLGYFLKRWERWLNQEMQVTIILLGDFDALRSLSLSIPDWHDALTTLAGNDYESLWCEENLNTSMEFLTDALARLSGIDQLTIGPDIYFVINKIRLADQMGLQRMEVFGRHRIWMKDMRDGWVELAKRADLEERWMIDFAGSEEPQKGEEQDGPTAYTARLEDQAHHG